MKAKDRMTIVALVLLAPHMSSDVSVIVAGLLIVSAWFVGDHP